MHGPEGAAPEPHPAMIAREHTPGKGVPPDLNARGRFIFAYLSPVRLSPVQ